jgi:hypothetical protein
MTINRTILGVTIDATITTTWAVRAAFWLLAAACGVYAVHLLATTDIPDTKPTTIIIRGLTP